MFCSIRYKNDNGITERSEFLAFDSDGAASDYATLASGRHCILDIWKGNVPAPSWMMP